MTARWLVIVGMLAMVAVLYFFRRRARRADGDGLERSDDVISRLGVRLTSALLAGGVVVYTVWPERLIGGAWPLSPLALWIGVGAAASGLTLMVWALRTLGAQWTTSIGTAQDDELITQGPYRWLRHPLSLAFALLVLALVLITRSWMLALLGVATFAWLVRRAVMEEQHLEQRFGQQYRDYSQRTGRFMPRRRDDYHADTRSRAAPH